MSVLVRLQAVLSALAALAGSGDEAASEALCQEAKALSGESIQAGETKLPAVR